MTLPPVFRYTIRFGNVLTIHRPRCPVLRRWPHRPAPWASGDPEELADRLFAECVLHFCKNCRAWGLWPDRKEYRP